MEDEDLFDEELLNDNLLTPEVQNAIASILPNDDPLDKTDFDLVEYINELFPNEQSLSNIDEIILRDRTRIRRIDSDIRSIIHNQTESAETGKASLEDAQKAIMHLFSQIKDIKVKAEKSEEMVKEITRDIKQLDVAKKNLTLSITTLNHLFILVEGVENLEELLSTQTITQNYSETADVFERVINVIDHFEPYLHIEQIADLSNRVKKIKGELCLKVRTEFESSFSNPFTKLNVKHGNDICKVVDVLDAKLMDQLIKWFLTQELKEYTVLFEENQENAWLDKIDRRYSWVKRSLAEFEEKFGKIFPGSWDMSERLAFEFCEVTRKELVHVMGKRKVEIDNKLLIFSIQRTSNFEQLLTKRFLGRSIARTKEQESVADEDWKPFLGLISQCFDAHFDIFISFTDQALSDLLTRFVEDIKTNGFPRMLSEDSNNLHNSSADLFIFFKNCMTQCLQLFTNASLLSKLALTFQKYLREYSHRILSSSLPKLSSVSSSSLHSSIHGAATSLIQNFQIQNILKEGGQSGISGISLSSAASIMGESSKSKLNESETCKICSILCTAEYCLETTQQLEDKLKEKSVFQVLNSGVREKAERKQIELQGKKINFGGEKDIFSNVISNCIQLLVQDLENSCEPALLAMSKISWHNISVVGDQSSYITAILNHIKNFVPLVRDNLANSRKFFTQFCSKFASNLIHKFFNNIFKCKMISQIGIEQLLLDAHSLKTALLELPTINSAISRKAPATYTKIVIKEMTRTELVLKSVMAPSEPQQAFVENYMRLNPDRDLETFRMVVEMKGYKKNELNSFLEIFKNKLASMNNFTTSAASLSST